MPRRARAFPDNSVLHVLNRGNERRRLFADEQEYAQFLWILDRARRCVPLDLYGYVLMPNHWHLVVRPEVDGEMGRFGQWLGLTHTRRHHAHYDTSGDGHLYQGRFKSFPVQDNDHFIAVCRYVERNAFTAGLCDRPDQWRFGSLWRWAHAAATDKSLLSP